MKALNTLSESFLQAHPTEAALALEGVEQKSLARFFGALAPQAAARVFEHFDPEGAVECLRRMTPRAAASIMEEMSAHPRVVALRLMSESHREHILSAFEERLAEQTRRMLRYADESVAALMETDVLTLPEDMRTDEAMRRIRRSRLRFEGELYVLDRAHRLVGVTTLHALLKAPPDQLVSASTHTESARVLGSTRQRDLVFHPLWAEHNSVAVVDEDEVLLGVIDHRAVAKAGERLRAESENDGGLEAALALGELYWTGLTGMLDGLAGRGVATTTTEDLQHGESSKS